MTDLKSEENKAWPYEKNQHHLYLALSSGQAESLNDECMMNPTIPLHIEPLGPVNPATTTYHNLCAISIIVVAFVAVESISTTRIRKLSRFESN